MVKSRPCWLFEGLVAAANGSLVNEILQYLPAADLLIEGEHCRAEASYVSGGS